MESNDSPVTFDLPDLPLSLRGNSKGGMCGRGVHHVNRYVMQISCFCVDVITCTGPVNLCDLPPDLHTF